MNVNELFSFFTQDSIFCFFFFSLFGLVMVAINHFIIGPRIKNNKNDGLIYIKRSELIRLQEVEESASQLKTCMIDICDAQVKLLVSIVDTYKVNYEDFDNIIQSINAFKEILLKDKTIKIDEKYSIIGGDGE